MGTLLRSELVTELSTFFADRADLTTARFVQWLNLAQTRIARLKDWEELQVLDTSSLSTVADNKFVTAPTDIRKIYSLRLIDGSNSRKLVRKQQRLFDQKIPYPERYASRRPVFYIYWSGKFEFYPVPDAAYTLHLRYIKWPTALTTGSDVASDLDQKDDALINLAASWGFASLRNAKDANHFWNIYKNIINEAAGEDVEGPDIDRVPDTNDGTPHGQYYLNPWVQDMSQVE